MATRWDEFRWDVSLWDDQSSGGGIDARTIVAPLVRPYRPRWQLFVRDGDTLGRCAELDEYDGIQFVCRHNGVGTWELTVPLDHPAATCLLQPRAGIIIERDGEVVLSGPRGARARRREAAGRASVTVSGWSDDVWLNRRVVLDPTDGTADPRTGVASTVMCDYLDAHVGPSAIYRAVPGLTVAADPVLGGTVTAKGRRVNLLELLTRLARQADPRLGFRVRQSDAALSAEVFEPNDVRASVVFSIEGGTVADWEYGDDPAEANLLWLGGEGTGASRLFSSIASSASIVDQGLIEQWVDHNDIDDPDDLYAAGEADLGEKTGTTRIEATPLNTDTLRWQRDWNLGDQVTVIVDGTKIVEQVREIAVELDPNGSESVAVRVGADGARLARQELGLMRRAAQAERRLRQLETV